MINQTIVFELIKIFNGAKLEKITILLQCLHNDSFKDMKMVNFIRISITMCKFRYNKYD